MPRASKTKQPAQLKKQVKSTNKSTAKVRKTSRNSGVSEKGWEVSQIIGIRMKNNKLEYSVHWENYPLRKATWEEESNVDNCEDLVKHFSGAKKVLEKLPKYKKTTKKPTSDDEEEYEVESVNGARIDVKQEGKITAYVSTEKS